MDSQENERIKKTRSPVVNRRIAQPAFLAAYAKCGNITNAARAAGISWSTHRLWLRDDEKYREAFELAEGVLIGQLEDEAWRRAVEGIEKPVFYKGVQCGSYRRYSNRLLIMLLKCRKPKKYGDRKYQDNSD